MVESLAGRERAATLEDVARLAGVSRATVSRVVNGGQLVAQDTVEAVNAAIAELGYHPNRAARALVTGRVGAVAVVVPEVDKRVFTDPFFPQAYHGALMAFAREDVQVLLAMAGPDDSAGRMARYLDSGHLDGAIVISHHGPALARKLQRVTYPVVFIGNPGVPGFTYVEMDNVGAAAMATRHLVERGARRIATITGPMDMGAGHQRLDGFESALAEAGLMSCGQVEGDFTVAGGEAAAAELLKAGHEFDGLFVASDLMALGAMRVLHRAGIEIPEQVKIVGFDNSSAALETEPRLTTVTNLVAEQAKLAGEMLLEMLAGGRPDYPVLLTSELIVRESA